MRRGPLLLLLEIVAITVPLMWLWIVWGDAAYGRFFLAVASPVFDWLGVTGIGDSPAQKRFISYVPFLVLMVVTPRLSPARRLLGTLVGFVLIFACHVGLVAVEYFAHTEYRLTPDPFSTLFPAAMFADAFPFLLWTVIAKDVVKGLLTRMLPPGETPAEGEEET